MTGGMDVSLAAHSLAVAHQLLITWTSHVIEKGVLSLNTLFTCVCNLTILMCNKMGIG